MQNKYIHTIFEKAFTKNARIVLPEMDSRVRIAQKQLKDYNIISVPIEEYAEHREKYIEFISHREFTKNWTNEMMMNYLDNPVHFAGVMVACDDADGMVAGASTPSSEIIRTAIRTVGMKESSRWVSSIFFMISPDGDVAYTYSDCGVIPEPDGDQLAAIAGDASQFHNLLTGEEPRVAFLSFSTKGSANHYRVERVKDAVQKFSKAFPEIRHEGELQFDAAIIPQVAKKKVSDSILNGSANVLIFPNLDAGNIAYKITERLAGYTALGPLLQGLRKPVHDLSRGCTVDDIIQVAAITAIQKVEYANV